MAFARGIGEYGSVVFISGNLPLKTEITPLLIVIKLEQFDYNGAAALGFMMLLDVVRDAVRDQPRAGVEPARRATAAVERRALTMAGMRAAHGSRSAGTCRRACVPGASR